MNNLNRTIKLMGSEDYKDRLRAEYYQTMIRHDKLYDMLKKWESNQLNFMPSCPRTLLEEQLEVMERYIDILEWRAKIERVEL